MLVIITGKPGMGKTLTLTDYARQCFKEDNPPLKVWFTEKILRKKWTYVNKIYSDYPIILKYPSKKHRNDLNFNVYDESNNIVQTNVISSLQGRIFDLTLDNKFPTGSKFFFDEIQAKYDSMDYKEFPDSIAHFCQAHRHFDSDIFISSQSQSRIIKRLVVLAEEYQDIRSFRKIFGFAIVHIRKTWDMSANLENGLYNDNISDVEYVRRIFRIKKVGKMYDSKYLRFLQQDSKPYKSKMYNSLQLSRNQLLTNFFPTDEEKERIKKLPY